MRARQFLIPTVALPAPYFQQWRNLLRAAAREALEAGSPHPKAIVEKPSFMAVLPVAVGRGDAAVKVVQATAKPVGRAQAGRTKSMGNGQVLLRQYRKVDKERTS